MTHNFFISHYNNDKEIAEIIAGTIQRITLRQILPWYSSDASSSGGLKPGNIWFTEIISKLKISKAIVAVLTPNSVNRPWIYFESGIGEALEGCEVIPICVGIKRDSVLPPLGMYQCYQLIDYRSLKEFCGKLLNKFEISFDEEMSRPILEKCITELSKISFGEKPQAASEEIATKNILQELKQHIDKRFIDVINNQQENKTVSERVANTRPSKKVESVSYTISIKFNFPEYKETQFLEIRNSDTVAEVYDAIWFIIRDYVNAFTYLQSWILIDYENNKKLIIREVASMIPATTVFRPGIVWQADKLKQEYRGSESSDKNNLR